MEKNYVLTREIISLEANQTKELILEQPINFDDFDFQIEVPNNYKIAGNRINLVLSKLVGGGSAIAYLDLLDFSLNKLEADDERQIYSLLSLTSNCKATLVLTIAQVEQVFQ